MSTEKEVNELAAQASADIARTERSKSFKRATEAFDAITSAMWHGLDFRMILSEDPEALAAAEKLVLRIRANKAKT